MILCNLCKTSFAKTPHRKWRKDDFDIVCCPSCGLIFRSELPDDKELSIIYADEYFFSDQGDTKGQGYQDYLKNEDFLRTNAVKRLSLLRCYCHSGKLLDIGCAAGFFLDEAQKLGLNVEGIELSKTMAMYGQKELGLTIKVGKFQDMQLSNAFDCITMWDYIEHSIDPAYDFEKIHSILKPRGIVVLTTGDIGSFTAKLSGVRWHLLTPSHHNFYFSKATMARYLRKFGFELLSVRYPANIYSLCYLTYKLRTIANYRFIKKEAEWLEKSPIGRLKIPVNLWDIMTTYARKI